MTLKDFYDNIGGDYKQVFDQLGDDDTIRDFLKRFFEEKQMENLKNLIDNKKYKDAFMCVHNMKGFGLNMALTPLHKKASVLCEELRNGAPKSDIKPMVDSLDKVYSKIEKVFSAL